MGRYGVGETACRWNKQRAREKMPLENKPALTFLGLRWLRQEDCTRRHVKFLVEDCSTPCSPQAPLPMDFPGKNSGVGSSFPSPGNLSDPGIRPRSPALQVVSWIASRFFTDWTTSSYRIIDICSMNKIHDPGQAHDFWGTRLRMRSIGVLASFVNSQLISFRS